MPAADLANVASASERFFRVYESHCVAPNRDTLFSMLEAAHSLNDRLRVSADLHFFQSSEFAALKCLRNYFHHHQELKHVVGVIPLGDYPITTDLMVLCLVPRDAVEAAIQQTSSRHREAIQHACQEKLHWYGQTVNINPCLFNFAVMAYEVMERAGVPMIGDAVHRLRTSYNLESQAGLSHFVDGYLFTLVGDIDQLLKDILAAAADQD